MNVEIVTFGDAKKMLRSVRFAVFVEEQGVPAELEMDEHDDASAHALILSAGKAVGVGRIQADGHIGRVAVLREFRGNGIGVAIMKRLVEHARESGLAGVYLGSQIGAVGFYERLGFESKGEVYLEAGIEHVDMRMAL